MLLNALNALKNCGDTFTGDGARVTCWIFARQEIQMADSHLLEESEVSFPLSICSLFVPHYYK